MLRLHDAKQIPRYQEKSDVTECCCAGEWAPMDNTERNKGFSAVVRKFPVGAVSMVSCSGMLCLSYSLCCRPQTCLRWQRRAACVISHAWRGVRQWAEVMCKSA